MKKNFGIERFLLCAAGIFVAGGVGAHLLSTPEPGEIEEIACKKVNIASYNPMWEYSRYGESAEEWQAEGKVSTHVCDDWKLTTSIPQHRALAKAVAEKLGRESVEYLWIPDSSAVEVTAQVTGDKTGELLGLSIDGETVWGGEEDYDIRELNVLEQWVLDGTKESICFGCGYITGFDTLDETYSEDFGGDYSPAELLARYEALTHMLYEEGVFILSNIPYGGYADMRIVDAETQEYLERWGREDGWWDVVKIPPSGKVALELQTYETCGASGEFRPEDCRWEQKFVVPMEPGYIVSFSDRHQRPAVHAEHAPLFYNSWEMRHLIRSVTSRVPLEVLAKYLPEDYRW